MERWHKADVCGDRGVLCLDCGGGHTDAQPCHPHISECTGRQGSKARACTHVSFLVVMIDYSRGT